MAIPSLTQTDRIKTAKVALYAGLGLAAFAWIAVTIAAAVKQPGIGSFFAGLFGGFVLALLIAGAAAWIAVQIAAPPRRFVDPSAGADLEASLRDVLEELEKSRLETLAKINARAAWSTPLAAAGGLAVWIMGQFTDDPGDLFDLTGMVVVLGGMGYVWASLALSNQYARLYKEKVLPRLAAAFGDITYRRAAPPDIERLKVERIFRHFDAVEADDELFGAHRGLPLSIIELKLTERQGKNRRTTFDGLLVEIELPRDTGAVTAIISDEGGFGNFRDSMLGGRERVSLEDPVFEKVYEVYGTDQVAARALLHPAFMEKLLALGERPDFGRPLALCVGRRLTFALPKRIARDLFEPPSFRQPAASRDALVTLKADIDAVIAAADAVIDLDHRFEVKPLA